MPNSFVPSLRQTLPRGRKLECKIDAEAQTSAPKRLAQHSLAQ